ncbi:MAG TPA: neutral zinc metallopeptidase [Bryobacteraceae bacterium]|nr:neutral zinc metallopeptidase [Bryobacteraceae bacterium]
MRKHSKISSRVAVGMLLTAASLLAQRGQPERMPQQAPNLSRLSTMMRMIETGVTPSDLAAMRAKNNMAISYLLAAWRDIFAGSMAPPAFRPFTAEMGTSGCGPVHLNNAEYCSSDHTIYYDEIFLATVMKEAAGNLGTDGDYAPITVLAHEFGHAVAIEKGYHERISLFAENAADCVAGVITAWAQRDGHIDRGDLEEAQYALSHATDPPGQTLVAQLLDPSAHGNRYQRLGAFTSGLSSGNMRVCVPSSAPGNYRGTR